MRLPLSPLVVAAALLAAPGAAPAVGQLADVSVIDRATGQTLPVYRHQGRLWVQGTPATRYAVRVHNRGDGRVMAVLSVDGVNAVSGQTAAYDQAGYVFAPRERHDVAGWRKSSAEIAAFYFTSLPDSYAARTGRPHDVGVIGVALFRERAPAVTLAPPAAPWSRRDEAANRERAEGPAAEAASAAKAADAGGVERRRAPAAPQPSPSLGTGHGERESSLVTTTTFERANAQPDETITLHYDSRENLLAMGVIRERQPLPRPRPFPAEPQVGYVPDPPRGW